MSRYSYSLLRRFALDLANCTRLVGNPFTAYRYLRSGYEPQVGSFSLGALRFKGRKEDWVAIREVLVEDEYSCIERILSPEHSPRILDLGANIGCFALRVFLHSPNAHVVSVEAADDTFEILATNRSENSERKWTVLKFGVWSHDGPLTLMRRGIPAGHRVVEGAGPEAVEGVSLQSLTRRLGWDNVDLIKMDIEGGEEAVIPASLDILRRTRFLIIEIHNDRIDPAPVLEILHTAYKYHWQLNDRASNKPVYVMANSPHPFGSTA